MPMLDEEGFGQVNELFAAAFRMQGHSIDERFQPVRDLYEEMTGMKETNHNAIMHHRISLYGPPCEDCGKPLRTSEAAFCAAYGWKPPVLGA